MAEKLYTCLRSHFVWIIVCGFHFILSFLTSHHTLSLNLCLLCLILLNAILFMLVGWLAWLACWLAGWLTGSARVWSNIIMRVIVIRHRSFATHCNSCRFDYCLAPNKQLNLHLTNTIDHVTTTSKPKWILINITPNPTAIRQLDRSV